MGSGEKQSGGWVGVCCSGGGGCSWNVDMALVVVGEGGGSEVEGDDML